MNACLVCGKEVKRNGNDYCSRECYLNAARSCGGIRSKEYKPRKCDCCGKQLTKAQILEGNRYCSISCRNSATMKRHRCVCKNCGKDYMPKTIDRITFCSRECSFEYKTAHKKQEEQVELKVYNKQCAHCGNEFESTYASQRYCSKRCNKKAATKRRTKKESTQYSVVCTECGKTFTTTRPKAKRCSDQCKRKYANRVSEVNRRHKLRENGRVDYSITLNRLVNRDNNICHICGAMVDMNADTNDGMYGSIDHVIPVSKGGTHTWDNVKLAHRSCNTIKRDTSSCMMDNGKIMLCI